ncbi:MAG: ATP-dependent helicase [Pirellulaceae bacterium]
MEFNNEQMTALTSDAKNLLVLAGAGTGKTRTIIGRAKFLLSQGVAPERIVIMTFTRRAAGEIRNRLKELAGDQAAKIITGTFHHFCLREMRSRPSWFGLSELTIMDRDDQLQLMKLARGKVVGRNRQAPQASELLTYYSYARNTNQPVRDYLEKFTDHRALELDVIEKVFANYKDRKKENGYFDYDDILHRFAKVLRSQDEVRGRIAGSFDHILVDEMQDTNPLQWLILESLATRANLFCVGDDAQSIYAFRGADFRNVHSFNQRLENAQTLKLELNYRSTAEILDVANWLLSGSDLEYGKRLRAARGPGMKPILCEFQTEFEEAAWIVKMIQERHRQGEAWREHMVLCRSGFNARPIEAQLIESKIPYRFVGGIGLLQMAHVRDLLSALRVIVNYRDELGWARYLTLWPRIGEVTASRWIDKIRESESTEQAIALLRQHSAREELVQPLEAVAQLVEQPAAAVERIADALDEVLAARFENWDSRLRDFALLIRLAENHKSLAGFLETYTLDPMSATEAQARSAGDDLVTLITVHSAKGTEAKTCFLVAANPGVYPHSRSTRDDEIEEERRILYVAMTRAKDELFISRSLTRGFGRASWNSIGEQPYFLKNLPRNLVKVQQQFAQTLTYEDDDEDFIR